MPRIKREGDQYEDDLHVRASAYLNHVLPDECIWWHTPNGARYDPARAAATAGLLAMMGLLPGIPDILVLYQGTLFGFDLKSVTGRATEAQIAVAARLNAAGAVIADPLDRPVRTLDQIEELLTEWSIPLKFSYRELKIKHFMKPHEAAAMTAIAAADKGLKARRAVHQRRKASAGTSAISIKPYQKKPVASR